MDEYDKLAEKTDNRMCEIDAELIGLEQPDESDEMTISNLLNLAKNADELFKSSKPAVKNQILRLLVSNLEIKQKRLSFNLLEPFNIIKKMDSRPIWLPETNDFRTACRDYEKEYGKDFYLDLPETFFPNPDHTITDETKKDLDLLFGGKK